MVKIESIDQLQKLQDELVVNMGNYDGVHIGHQQLIQFLKEEADKHNAKLCLFTFKPHPRIYFERIDNFLLQTPSQKHEQLAKCGVDYLVELDFKKVSELSAENFLDHYIKSIPVIKYLYLGYDFRFGKDKKGDFILANNVLKNESIDLYKSPEFFYKDHPVSSSIIRDHLIMGEIVHANELLNRPYQLKGNVVKGFGKGKQIGIPTINMDISSEYLIPKKGVYFSKINFSGQDLFGITNIGINPTFGRLDKTSVETHIFNFGQDIYGEEVSLEFYHYHRSEKKFSSVKELVAQIQSDIKLAKNYWNIN